MADYTQKNRPLEVVTPLGTDVLLITGFRGEEGISRLFRFHVDMVADIKKDIAFEQVLGQKITVRLNIGNKPRYFSGICTGFSQAEADNDFCSYQLEMAPQFWLLTKVAQSRIFQQQTVPDILKTVLKGLDPNVSYVISGTYQQRNYCVQYRETDFNFACRLMEEEGIFFFFTHTADGHKLVVADSAASHPDLPLAEKLTFQKRVQDKWAEDRVLTWQRQQALLTGQFTLWDHCFEFPGRNLQAKATVGDSVQAGKVKHQLKAGKAEGREVYDFPGAYAVRFDGVDSGGNDQPADVQKILKDNDRTVGLRHQEEAARGVVILGASSCRNLVSGHKFTLQNHVNANGEYLVTTIKHEVTSTVTYRSAADTEFRYQNTFTAMPFAAPYRPQRQTPRPFVQGTQTATVVGPAGQEIFTDKYGRVKVQFNWDRVGKRDAKSSCWVRVGQAWAGKRWGASFWPRIGQEVIVAFLEGNPDWPIIVGSVYNAEQMPPYLGDGLDSKHPKDNKVTGVKSNSTPGGDGFNEWRFDDTKGKEQIFIHGERNIDTTIKNDAMERIFGDSHLIVGPASPDQKKGDQREQIQNDKHLNVKRHQIEKIEGNLQLTVGKGSASDGGNVDVNIEKDKAESIGKGSQVNIQEGRLEQVGKDQHLTVNGNLLESAAQKYHLTVGSDRNEKVGGTQSLTVASNQYEKVGQAHALEAGQTIYIKAGTTLVIEAGTQISLKVGGNFVDIGAAGVSIVGSIVKINSGGSPASGSAPSPTAPTAPTAPQDAKEAKPTAPTLADDSKSGQKSAPS